MMRTDHEDSERDDAAPVEMLAALFEARGWPCEFVADDEIHGEIQGAWASYPNRCAIDGISNGTGAWDSDDGLDKFYEKYEHPIWTKVGDAAREAGGHGGMDFVMLWRIVYCLRNGLPIDQDVYDAASWSVISPLSEWSVANRGGSIDVPDFTRGNWGNVKPLVMVP